MQKITPFAKAIPITMIMITMTTMITTEMKMMMMKSRQSRNRRQGINRTREKYKSQATNRVITKLVIKAPKNQIQKRLKTTERIKRGE